MTFDPSRQPAEFLLAVWNRSRPPTAHCLRFRGGSARPLHTPQASAGALVPVVVALVRVYLGWAYVGNRLLSAVVEYEETGWRV